MKWVLDQSFLHLTRTGSDGSSLQVFTGVDPATKQLSYWGFDNNGGVWRGTIESPKADEWVFRVTGHGKNGPSSFKSRVVKLGENSSRTDFEEFIVDGKKQAPASLTWTRKR